MAGLSSPRAEPGAPTTVSRRGLITAALSTAVLGALPGSVEGAASLGLGPARPFSQAWLRDRAQALARRPFQAPSDAWAGQLADLDFDALGAIRYRAEAALWPGDGRIGAVEFFHLGRYARTPVAIHLVEGRMARQILYAPELFDIPPDNPARRLPPSLGFAGFRVMNPAAPGDWIAYQGASYFRAADPFNQYGLSARGLAIDTATAAPEEFPAFTAFWLEATDQGLLVSALLEGPSVSGAFAILHRRGPTGLTQEISTRLTFRSTVRRLGVAPLTSMFWYGAADRTKASDWRPQVHDSDGLSILTGEGERIWRPLDNPPRVMTNAFLDNHPRGFGLMQRDRRFEDYQDDGAFYDRRPSAWVEPVGDWGAGSVQLVEIPTEGETDDNVVAFWSPAAPVASGETVDLRYRLHWAAAEPTPVGVAQVVATRMGRGGRPGQPPPPRTRKYVVDFQGGRLAGLTRASGVTPVVTSSEGAPISPTAYPVVGTDRWRLAFDFVVEQGKVVNLRAFLRQGVDSLTETWIGQAFG